MLNNPNCTVLGSFVRDNKLYVTLEFDLSNNNLMPAIPEPRISIGNFRIEANTNGDTLTIAFYYGDFHITSWNIQAPENACVHLGDLNFEYGIGIRVKDIQVCLDSRGVCLKAGVYVTAPIVGEYHVDDIDICSSDF